MWKTMKKKNFKQKKKKLVPDANEKNIIICNHAIAAHATWITKWVKIMYAFAFSFRLSQYPEHHPFKKKKEEKSKIPSFPSISICALLNLAH